MKKICLLFGILFLFVNIVFAQDYLAPSVNRTGSFVAVSLASFDSPNAYKLYREELEQIIFNKWTFANTGLHVNLVLKINKDGSFEDLEIFNSSDNIEFDKNAINTLKSLKQLKPLPENYPFPYAKAFITFSDNVKKHEDIDFGPYMQKLQKTIKSNWYPPKYNTSQTITVLFKMHKDGTITDAKIFYSAGIPDLDAAAIQAVNSVSGKFPLPKEFTGKSVDIQFTFSYYGVYGANGKRINNNHTQDVSLLYKELMPERLYATTKESIRLEGGYKFLNVLQMNKITSNAYLWKCKVDCKNKQIGIKKSYAGSPKEILANPRTFFLYKIIFQDNIKMYSVNEKTDYTKIYEYACQP